MTALPVEESIGEWKSNEDELGANPGAKESWLAAVSAEENQEWLAEPPFRRGDALRNMSADEYAVFSFLVALRPMTLLARVWQFPQKSEPWKWARTGRITGSSTGAAVGQQRKTRVKKAAHAAVYLKFKGSAATIWGSGKEVYATKCYANDLKRIVTRVFREQRKAGLIQASAKEDGKGMHFVFRNQEIPVPDINADPEVEVRVYGLLIDPWNHWRGVSPDGVIFINGVPCGVLEVKCPAGKKHALYTNVRPYYYNQLMCEMYICNRYWPQIRWLDFCVWSPTNFTVEPFVFDADYFFQWYAPRELKYYFGLYLPTLAERVRFTAQVDSGNPNPSPHDFQKALVKLFAIPPLPSAACSSTTDSLNRDSNEPSRKWSPRKALYAEVNAVGAALAHSQCTGTKRPIPSVGESGVERAAKKPRLFAAFDDDVET